ncbi:hypothetical protein D3C80_1293780 [compost metagenome]
MASALALPIPFSSFCKVSASAVFKSSRCGCWTCCWLTTGNGSGTAVALAGAALREKDRLANSGSSRYDRTLLRMVNTPWVGHFPATVFLRLRNQP